MPLISSTYRPPLGFANGYMQSIYPTLFRRLATSHLQHETLELSDGDFLDLDWSRGYGKQLVIVSHGLEGHSRRPYVAGVVREANRQGYDALSWNFRGCSGRPNRLTRSYHSGATEDLAAVIHHAQNQGYQHVHLVGFSMGGNLSLLYLGRDSVATVVRSAVAFSVPCDLKASAEQLARRRNRIFMWRFLRDLRGKMTEKAQRFPAQVQVDDFHQIRNFRQFDDRYTAPLHGFSSALDYWQRSSCLPYLSKILHPALLVNALDDPFLTPSCYPRAIAQSSPWLHLELPAHGGHVGFIERGKDQVYWMERRAMAFIRQHSPDSK